MRDSTAYLFISSVWMRKQNILMRNVVFLHKRTLYFAVASRKGCVDFSKPLQIMTAVVLQSHPTRDAWILGFASVLPKTCYPAFVSFSMNAPLPCGAVAPMEVVSKSKSTGNRECVDLSSWQKKLLVMRIRCYKKTMLSGRKKSLITNDKMIRLFFR